MATWLAADGWRHHEVRASCSGYLSVASPEGVRFGRETAPPLVFLEPEDPSRATASLPARRRQRRRPPPIEMAHWSRSNVLSGMRCNSDAGSQFTSIRYGERLAEIRAVPSIRAVGDSYANALAEAVYGYYEAELI